MATPSTPYTSDVTVSMGQRDFIVTSDAFRLVTSDGYFIITKGGAGDVLTPDGTTSASFSSDATPATSYGVD